MVAGRVVYEDGALAGATRAELPPAPRGCGLGHGH
jgi:hypothetical protein